VAANILITGGSGFLGSALAHYWVEAGYKITILVRPNSDLYRLEGIFENIEIIKIDGEKKTNELILYSKPEIIVHTAVNYGRNNETIPQIYDANYSFGLNLLHGVLAGGRKVVFINTDTVIQPSVNTYAKSKREFAKKADEIAKQNPTKLKFINTRLQLMYGAEQNKLTFPGFVFKECIENNPHIRLTTGEQLRDFIYIEDCISAFNIIVKNTDKFTISDEIDIGSGKVISVRKFAEKIQKLTKSKTQLNFGEIPHRENEPLLCKGDIRRLKSLGWKQNYEHNNGIMKTIEIMSKNMFR